MVLGDGQAKVDKHYCGPGCTLLRRYSSSQYYIALGMSGPSGPGRMGRSGLVMIVTLMSANYCCYERIRVIRVSGCQPISRVYTLHMQLASAGHWWCLLMVLTSDGVSPVVIPLMSLPWSTDHLGLMTRDTGSEAAKVMWPDNLHCSHDPSQLLNTIAFVSDIQMPFEFSCPGTGTMPTLATPCCLVYIIVNQDPSKTSVKI